MNPDPKLIDLAVQLEGSTHGGPRHSFLFDEIRRRSELDPARALDSIEAMPSSARSAMLMALSGLGRELLPTILRRLRAEVPGQRRDAAMILYIWATRGLLSGVDRPAIEDAVMDADDETRSMVSAGLSQLRT